MKNEMNRSVTTNDMNNQKASGTEEKMYRCKICNEETSDSVDAITHQLEHSSNALEAISDLMKEQKYGGSSKANISNVSGDKSSKMDDMAKTPNQDMAKMPAAPNAARMDTPSNTGESAVEGDRANRYANSYKAKKAGNNR